MNFTPKSKFSYTRAAALNSDTQMQVANNISLLWITASYPISATWVIMSWHVARPFLCLIYIRVQAQTNMQTFKIFNWLELDTYINLSS